MNFYGKKRGVIFEMLLIRIGVENVLGIKAPVLRVITDESDRKRRLKNLDRAYVGKVNVVHGLREIDPLFNFYAGLIEQHYSG